MVAIEAIVVFEFESESNRIPPRVWVNRGVIVDM